MTSYYGPRMTLFYKDGCLKQNFNSTHPKGIREATYYQPENMVYMKIGNSDTLYWHDCGVDGEFTSIKVSKVEKADSILHIACNLITVTSSLFVVDMEMESIDTFYFSKSLKIDPKKFASCTYGG